MRIKKIDSLMPLLIILMLFTLTARCGKEAARDDPENVKDSIYHWNSLTGEGWKDSWDPQNPVTPKDPSSFMDIDEYMALTQAEMMMQFISGGLDYAVFWPIQWPDEASRIRSFYNTATNNANPNYQLFQFLGKMQGGLYIPGQVVKPGNRILSLVVRDSNLKTVRICILNKSTTNQVADIQWDAFQGMKFLDGFVYSVNSDGSNFMLSRAELLKSDKPEITKLMSKAVSLTMLTFEEK